MAFLFTLFICLMFAYLLGGIMELATSSSLSGFLWPVAMVGLYKPRYIKDGYEIVIAPWGNSYKWHIRREGSTQYWWSADHYGITFTKRGAVLAADMKFRQMRKRQSNEEIIVKRRKPVVQSKDSTA